jgi:signal transduction histidine kinase
MGMAEVKDENAMVDKSPTTPLSPEMLVPRLGEYLVQKDLITEEQLAEALRLQQEKLGSQKRYMLGEALVELGFVERRAIDHAITELIIQLRNALEDANRNLEKRVRERTAELQEALRKLSELNQLKANFVANISHELRTPLTHIKGYLELLYTSVLGDLNDEQKNAVEVSRRASGRLENLVENLIMFSVASKGEMTLKLTPVVLESIIEHAIASPRAKAEEKNIIFRLEIVSGLPLVKADAEKIKWVISQLLDNAVKFTNAGGQVTLSIQPEAEKLVMVSVADTGIGISEQNIKDIFEPFHQLDGSATRRFGGTGMGLALARQIIEAHGSVIEVESAEGKGSTFRFPLLIAETSS